MEEEKQQSLLGLGAGVYKDYAAFRFATGGYFWKGTWGGVPGAGLFKNKILKYDKLYKPKERLARVFFGGYGAEAKAPKIAEEIFAESFGKFKTANWLNLKSKTSSLWAKRLASGDISKFGKAQQEILRRSYKSYARHAWRSGNKLMFQDKWLKTKAYKSKPIQKMMAASIERAEKLKIKKTAYQFTKKGMEGVKGVGGLKTLGRVLGGVGIVLTAATVVSDVTKIASAVGSMTVDLPLFIEQKTAPLKKLLVSHPEFGGSQTAARYGATERARALQAITTSGGIINDRRFIGQEARYYSQF